jgi:hypothetical protein
VAVVFDRRVLAGGEGLAGMIWSYVTYVIY